jgi:hypothetical protein
MVPSPKQFCAEIHLYTLVGALPEPLAVIRKVSEAVEVASMSLTPAPVLESVWSGVPQALEVSLPKQLSEEIHL